MSYDKLLDLGMIVDFIINIDVLRVVLCCFDVHLLDFLTRKQVLRIKMRIYGF